MMPNELRHDYNLNESWATIIAISQEIELLASQESWESVVDSAKQRHQAVVTHFNRFPVGPDNAVFYMEHLNSFMQNEERLQIIVNKARMETMQAISEFNKNRQAAQAYQTF
jgi:hypothetical protein